MIGLLRHLFMSPRPDWTPPESFVLTTNPTLINASERAIVYLTVDWSGPEVRTRVIVRQALAELHDLPVEFFAVSEDEERMRPWLRALGWPEYKLGYGSILWLEHGKQIGKELLPGHVGSVAFVEKTRALWGNRAS